MRQLIQHRLKTNIVGKTGHVQPSGNYVKKITALQKLLLSFDDLDIDNMPDKIIFQAGKITVTEDADSFNIDINGDGIIDFVVPK